MKVYKLFRQLNNGDITSLFINKSRHLPCDVWLDAESFPTKGFTYRPYWHCTEHPVAPHLKMKLKSGEQRVWRQVLIEDYEEFDRPTSQGGKWYLANKMKIIKPI